jgi:hypothetical protein
MGLLVRADCAILFNEILQRETESRVGVRVPGSLHSMPDARDDSVAVIASRRKR